MTIPEGFEKAHDGLIGLVRRVASGDVRDEVLGEEVEAWRRGGCRGRATLAEAASSATRYGLELRGLREGPASVSKELRALGSVRSVLERPAGEQEEIVEVELAEDFVREHPKARGFRMGELKIVFRPTTKRDGVVHFSVSHPFRYPTWEELLRARTAPGGPPPHLWAWLPKPGTEPGIDPYTLHLYFVPPEGFVG